jgi:hypothetical protein
MTKHVDERDREGVAAKQAKLFADDLTECAVRSQKSVL